jgi:hypothetical protein
MQISNEKPAKTSQRFATAQFLVKNPNSQFSFENARFD